MKTVQSYVKLNTQKSSTECTVASESIPNKITHCINLKWIDSYHKKCLRFIYVTVSFQCPD